MINTDGYYISEGKLYNERNTLEGNWYYYIAYLFQKNGIFIKSTKFSKDKETIKFHHSDFLLENTNAYEFNDDQIILIYNTGKDWEHKEILKRHKSGYIFKNGDIINYQDWE